MCNGGDIRLEQTPNIDLAGIYDIGDGKADDRMVFTEDNPFREFTTAAQLAAASRSMTGYSEVLADKSLKIAKELYEITEVRDERCRMAKMHAAIELFLSTGEDTYRNDILAHT